MKRTGLYLLMFLGLTATVLGILFWMRAGAKGLCGHSILGEEMSRTVVDARVAVDWGPGLYEPKEVDVSVRACEPIAGELEAWLELPPTAAFIKGQTGWRGHLEQGETYHFKATVAFIATGISGLRAWVRYPWGAGRMRTNGDGAQTWVRVTQGEHSPPPGSTPRPVPLFLVSPEPRNPSDLSWIAEVSTFTPPVNFFLDGSSLLNREPRPRAFLIYDREGLNELVRAGLVPDDLWGRWLLEAGHLNAVLKGDQFRGGAILALYDRNRPTTGYAFAVLRDKSAWLGSNTLVLDIVSTSPFAPWPVEQREVSPYELRLIPYGLNGPETELKWLVLRANGEVLGHYALNPGHASLEELPLPPFQEAALPWEQ